MKKMWFIGSDNEEINNKFIDLEFSTLKASKKAFLKLSDLKELYIYCCQEQTTNSQELISFKEVYELRFVNNKWIKQSIII